MFEDYKVAVKLTLINDLSKGLLLASSQFKELSAQADLFNAKVNRIKELSFVGGGIIGGAFAIAAPFVYAISKAAELQKQMISIQIATAGTADEMDKMRIAIEKASSTTMFSAYEVAGMGKIIATSNSFNAKQVTSLLPEYAKFADVQLLLKGTSYQESVLEAVRLAHTANIYDPSKLASYLDTLTKASLLSGGNLTELGTALKYSQGTAQQALGVSPKQMILVTALANRLGFAGSRGGTNVIDAMIRTMPGVFGSGLLKGKSHEALHAMGLTDSHGRSLLFTNGKFDIMKWIEGLSSYVSKEMRTHPEAIARQDILTNFQHAFGSIGRRFATLLGPIALQQLVIMEKQFEKLASNAQIQDIFVKKSVSQQFRTAVTNFQNVMIDLGTNLLPLATDVLNRFNHELNIFIPWMRENKELIKHLSEGFLALAASMAIGGTLAILTSGFVALTSTLGLVVSSLAAITFGFHELLKALNAIKFLTSGKADFKSSDWSAVAKEYYSNPKNQSFFVKHFGYSPTKQENDTHFHLFLDSKEIAHSVSKVQAKEAAKQPAHGSLFNSNISLQPNMLNQGGSL